MNSTTLSIVIAGLLVFGAVILTASPGKQAAEEQAANNVAMEGGTQVITIDAKGGYAPRITYAKAGIPSEIRLETANTYDCSAAVVIPSLNYREFLPPNGEKIVPVPPQEPGTVLRGLCSMGMYNFAIQFD